MSSTATPSLSGSTSSQLEGSLLLAHTAGTIAAAGPAGGAGVLHMHRKRGLGARGMRMAHGAWGMGHAVLAGKCNKVTWAAA